MLNVCNFYIKFHDKQTNKQNAIITTDRELLGLVPNLKYKLLINSASKISSTYLFCNIGFFSISRKSFLICATSRSSLTNFEELMSTMYINVKK